MSLTSSTYLGVPVLDSITGADAPAEDSPSRRITVLGGPGPFGLDAHEALQRYRRTLLIQCFNATEVDEVYAFMDARLGRLRPFWLPTWDMDLTVNSYIAASVDLAIEYCGYSSLMFPLGASRRHIQVTSPSGTIYRRRITGATWATGPEALVLSAAIAEGLPAGTRIGFLRYCHLDDDIAKMAFAGGYAECELPVIELPQECPT